MKAILPVLVSAAVVVGATGYSWGGGWVDDFVAHAIAGKSEASASPKYLAAPQPGYIPYPDGDVALLPKEGCYWTRIPLYDAGHKVVGWRGRAAVVCPQSKVPADLALRH